MVYLLHFQLLPEKRLAELMADLFGVHLATATIASMSQACAARLQGFVLAVRDHVAAAPVKIWFVLSRSRVTPGLPRSEQRVHNIAKEVVAAVEEAEPLIASPGGQPLLAGAEHRGTLFRLPVDVAARNDERPDAQ